MRKFYTLFICLITAGLLVTNVASDSVSIQGLNHLVVDVRGSRGGNGDVAAGYLTAIDLIRRHDYSGEVTFLMDEPGQEILVRMLNQDIRAGQSITRHGRDLRFHTLESAKGKLPPADLVLQMARISGVPDYQDSFVFTNNALDTQDYRLRVRENRGLVMTYTVLGNTENTGTNNPYSSIWQSGDNLYQAGSAGVARNEGGIYVDPVANELAGKTPDELQQYILKQSSGIADPTAREFIEGLMNGETFAGSEIGLAYGIHREEQIEQFNDYLDGMSSHTASTGKPLIMVTPLPFSQENVPDFMSSQVEVIDPANPPPNPRPGKIYVASVGALPHEVFTGLLGYSQVPPVVAGDSALSAAIRFKRPFVMTSVPWNAANIANLGDRLKENATDPDQTKLIDAIFPPDGSEPRLNQASQLVDNTSQELFNKTARNIPTITDSIVGNFQSFQNASGEQRAITQSMDPILKRSVFLRTKTDAELEKLDLDATEKQVVETMVEDLSRGTELDPIAREIITRTDYGQERFTQSLKKALIEGDAEAIWNLSEAFESIPLHDREGSLSTGIRKAIETYLESKPDPNDVFKLFTPIKPILDQIGKRDFQLLVLKAEKTGYSLLADGFSLLRNDSPERSERFIQTYLRSSEVRTTGEKEGLKLFELLSAISESGYTRPGVGVELAELFTESAIQSNSGNKETAKNLHYLMEHLSEADSSTLIEFHSIPEAREGLFHFVTTNIADHNHPPNLYDKINRKMHAVDIWKNAPSIEKIYYLESLIEKGRFTELAKAPKEIVGSRDFLEMIARNLQKGRVKENFAEAVSRLSIDSSNFKSSLLLHSRQAKEIFEALIISPSEGNGLDHQGLAILRFPPEALGETDQARQIESIMKAVDRGIYSSKGLHQFEVMEYFQDSPPTPAQHQKLGELGKSAGNLTHGTSQDAAILYISTGNLHPDDAKKYIEEVSQDYPYFRDQLQTMNQKIATKRLQNYLQEFGLCL